MNIRASNLHYPTLMQPLLHLSQRPLVKDTRASTLSTNWVKDRLVATSQDLKLKIRWRLKLHLNEMVIPQRLVLVIIRRVLQLPQKQRRMVQLLKRKCFHKATFRKLYIISSDSSKNLTRKKDLGLGLLAE